jgi:hypothetical protein
MALLLLATTVACTHAAINELVQCLKMAMEGKNIAEKALADCQASQTNACMHGYERAQAALNKILQNCQPELAAAGMGDLGGRRLQGVNSLTHVAHMYTSCLSRCCGSAVRLHRVFRCHERCERRPDDFRFWDAIASGLATGDTRLGAVCQECTHVGIYRHLDTLPKVNWPLQAFLKHAAICSHVWL